jgi:hypothetical protein
MPIRVPEENVPTKFTKEHEEQASTRGADIFCWERTRGGRDAPAATLTKLSGFLASYVFGLKIGFSGWRLMGSIWLVAVLACWLSLSEVERLCEKKVPPGAEVRFSLE